MSKCYLQAEMLYKISTGVRLFPERNALPVMTACGVPLLLMKMKIPSLVSISLYEIRGWLSLIITALFVFFSYVAWKKQRAVFFGLIFFAIPLLLVLYIPGLGENTFAERYLYLPSVGLSILVVFFIKWARTEMPKVGYGVTLMSFLLIGIYSVGTITRNAVWKDNATLYIDTIKKSPGASIIRNNYGNILERKGRIDEAIEQYQAALTANPNYDLAHSNLGLAFFKKGLIDEAIEQYRIALKINPAYSNAYNNLGVAYGASGWRAQWSPLFVPTAARINFWNT